MKYVQFHIFNVYFIALHDVPIDVGFQKCFNSLAIFIFISSMGKIASSEMVATICSYVHMRIDSILSVTVYYIATGAVFMIH